MMGQGGPQACSREGAVHSLDTALVSPTAAPRAIILPQAVQSGHQREPGWDKEANCERVFSFAKGKKINKHSLAWGGEAIRSSKTNVASFFWWGLSALAFTEDLDSQVYHVLCICSQYISER